MADTLMADAPADPGAPFSLRPRFKLSELPLVKEQRVAVDSLLLKFKKQGGYDALRKDVWKSFITSDAKTALTDQIHGVAEAEIDKNPSLLSRERGKAATLIQGALDRSGVYQDVESMIDTEISKHLDNVLDAVRDIRKADVGKARAMEEEQRGSKTDDQYRAETEARAEERSKNRARMEELARQTAELKRKIAMQEEKKRREEQAKRDEEDRRRREKEDEDRRERRRKRQEEEDRREAERVKARDERARKREEERKARRREDRDRDRDPRSSSRHTSRRRESVANKDKELDDMDLEATALEMLLNESKKMADKSRTKPDLDRADARRRRDRSPADSRRRSRSRGKISVAQDAESKQEESEEREEGEAVSRKGSPSPRPRTRRPRSASPLNIDRYVPGGGAHRTEEDRDRGKDRRPIDEIEADETEARVEKKSEIGSELTDVTASETESGIARDEEAIDATETETETSIDTSQDEAVSRSGFEKAKWPENCASGSSIDDTKNR
ncbi:hypothetical protein DV736_g3509, partial [Chaetothyriales sp. CBS 134916]